MARIPLATREQIAEKEQPAYDAFMQRRADDIRERRPLKNLDPDEQTVVDFTRELLQNRKVSRPTFDAATARFGQRGTMTLTNLIACYAVLAYNMNTYELEAPAHATERALT